MGFAMGLDAAIAWLKGAWGLSSRILAPLAPLLALALALSHCSDKRHTRQRDEARAQLDMVKRASDANLAAQKAQVKALEAKYTEQAKENVRVETQIRTVYRDRADAYADRMRSDKVCQRPAGGTGESPVAPQPDSPGPTAVILERRDFDQLVENSARLEAAHRWAQSLIDDGTAEVVKAGVPDVGF